MRKLVSATLAALCGTSLLATPIYAKFECDQGQAVLEFTKTDFSHEQFYCTISGPTTFYNIGEMMSGFTQQGTFRALFPEDVKEVNQYYFDAFHDPEPRYKGQPGLLCASSKAKVECHMGKGNRQKQFGGSYG